MLYMVTFTINIPQMLAYIPYMDPMGNEFKMLDLRCILTQVINGNWLHDFGDWIT